jgi:hypothetical protein
VPSAAVLIGRWNWWPSRLTFTTYKLLLKLWFEGSPGSGWP